jgi:hypothetical protein
MVNSTNNIIIKSMIIGFVPLVLLFSGLVQNPFFVVPVFAEPPDPCFGDGCEGGFCNDLFPGKAVQCCWNGPNGNSICQLCWTDDQGNFFYCDPPRTKDKADSSTIAPPPSGVAPPPSTQTCPENTALDANGNCAPLTQGPTDQGTTAQPPSSTDDNKPPKPKLPKGDILDQSPSSTDDNKPPKPKLPKGD